jgi:hypothetical protein
MPSIHRVLVTLALLAACGSDRTREAASPAPPPVSRPTLSAAHRDMVATMDAFLADPDVRILKENTDPEKLIAQIEQAQRDNPSAADTSHPRDAHKTQRSGPG